MCTRWAKERLNRALAAGRKEKVCSGTPEKPEKPEKLGIPGNPEKTGTPEKPEKLPSGNPEKLETMLLSPSVFERSPSDQYTSSPSVK